MRSSIPLKIMAITLILLVTSCKGRKKEYHNIIDKIRAQSVENSRDSIEEQSLYSMNELVSIDENDIYFYIKKRKNSIKSYACSECHNKPVDQLQKEGLGKKAHWDIMINHADTKTMTCTSCHNGGDMNN